jgi:hydroxyethylthiazole kinase
MAAVTAMGCTSTAIMAAFYAVNPDYFQASVHAFAVMGICGEWARERSQGPGSFRAAFVDALSLIGPDLLENVRASDYAL